MEQIDLVPYEQISYGEMLAIVANIRSEYWFLRNLRGHKFGSAKRRRHYRNVEKLKYRLMLSGIPKRDILDLLACCRLSCSARKQPFNPCKYCCK